MGAYLTVRLWSLLTMENKYVPSAKSFEFESKFSVRSIIYKKDLEALKQKIEEHVTLLSAQDECWQSKNFLISQEGT